jgi:hypothetical protein
MRIFSFLAADDRNHPDDVAETVTRAVNNKPVAQLISHSRPEQHAFQQIAVI